jgi:hypothetical protein
MKTPLLFSVLAISLQTSFAQLPYLQTFDGPTAPALPSGVWVSSATDFIMDNGKPSKGYTGASGGYALRINPANNGIYSVVLGPISTLGFQSIMANYGQYQSTQFTTINYSDFSFSWSSDSTTWNDLLRGVDDTKATNAWMLASNGLFFSLPVGADNQAKLYFKWTANYTGLSGSYRIDDFAVTGNGIVAGIEQNDEMAASELTAFYDATSSQLLFARPLSNTAELLVTSSAGETVKTLVLPSSTQSIPMDLGAGLYIVSVKNGSELVKKKILVQ